MTTRIHPTAIVEAGAELDDDVQIGPYTLVGSRVRIGRGSRVDSHCVLAGDTTIGRDNHIHSHNSIGQPPQDKKYAGEVTRLEIGDRNTIREFCTFNTGTVQDEGVTRIGDDNWIMAYVHIAHDCRVGNHTIFANNAQIAGHVHVGDWVILGGMSGVHQFCRLGAHAMLAASSKLVQDIPPFVMADGGPAAPRGINSEGLRRRGFSADDIDAIKRAYKLVYRDGLLLDEAKRQIAELAQATASAHVKAFADFIAASQRGIVR
ncbi:MAG TPA: acyl-ACP--UDP-N-acetylglucosamine O-acyltransferase [Burkholderiaceae bacterium]|nr:acyl-ACP--UDP-N-acetylglucosamine O-acyltransferase [Burkholderiaceae bacterium]